MKILVLKLNIRDVKDRTKAMTIISNFGVESVVANNGGTLTVIGNIDPVTILTKLRKKWDAHIVSVGPAYELEELQIAQPQLTPYNYQPYVKNPNAYDYNYHPYVTNPNAYDYNYQPNEENPNACVIT